MEPNSKSSPKYPVPPLLQGILSQSLYNTCVRVKSWTLFKRDKRRKLPFAITGTIEIYKNMVHSAMCASTMQDPYTGDTLDCGLIAKWVPAKAKGDSQYIRQFYLLPTVDHIDPDSQELRFEICSWKINC